MRGKNVGYRRIFTAWCFICLFGLFVLSAKTVHAGSKADYKGAVQEILAALDNYEESVNIEDYNIPYEGSSISTLSNMINFDYPQYIQYYGLGTYYSTTKNSVNIIKKVTLMYKTDSAEETKKIRNAYEQKVASILSYANPNWTDFEKILYANDWLSVNCVYGHMDNGRQYDAYGAIVLGTAVCSGYSQAFQDLMNRFGIECQSIHTPNHAWNVVKLGSKWYHVDVTFNSSSDYRGEGSADHAYLLRSGTSMSTVPRHTVMDDWTYMGSAEVGDDTDTTYDSYFWSNVSKPFFYYDGYWYGLVPQTQDGSRIGEYVINQYTGTSTGLTYQKTIKTLPEDSYDSEELADWLSGSFYGLSFSGNYTGFASCGKYLYYSDPHTIYCLDITTGAEEIVCELTSSQKQKGIIDGISVNADGILSYDFLTGYDGNRLYTKKKITVHTHNYISETISEATFVSTGTKIFNCLSCGQTYTKVTAKLSCKKGEIYTVGNYNYEIISAKTNGKGTVAFIGLSGIEEKVTIDNKVKILGARFKIVRIADGVLKNQTGVTSVSVGDNVTAIGKRAFYGCKKLTAVTGCASVTSVGGRAFYKCINLKQVGSKNGTVTLANIETIGNSAFYGCKAIRKVKLTSAALTTIGESAFRKCTALTSFISKSKKLKKIKKNAFRGDKKLSAVTLKTSKLTDSSVKANAFKGIKAACVFKVPSAKVSAYKKLFKSRGAVVL